MNEQEHDPNLLAAFLEDRLDRQERARLVEHLAGCAECRGALALLGRAAAAGALPAIPPVAEPRPERLPWRIRSRIWLPIAASVAVAATLLVRLLPVTSPTGDFSPSPSDTARGLGRASPPATEPARSPEPRPFSVLSAKRHSPVDESLLVKRGGERRVAGKAFRLMAGEWVDLAFDPRAALPTVSVAGSEDRAALLARVPSLAPYARLGERVVVVLDGAVYRFAP